MKACFAARSSRLRVACVLGCRVLVQRRLTCFSSSLMGYSSIQLPRTLSVQLNRRCLCVSVDLAALVATLQSSCKPDDGETALTLLVSFRGKYIKS